MNKERLKEAIEEERRHTEPAQWTKVPDFIYEVGRLLLDHARSDFGVDADVMEERLGELQKVRWDKLQTGLGQLEDAVQDGAPIYPELANLSATECNTLRPFLVETLGRIARYIEHQQPGRHEFYGPPTDELADEGEAGEGGEPGEPPRDERAAPRALRRE